MSHETSIRLPVHLRGVLRADAAAASAVAPPIGPVAPAAVPAVAQGEAPLRNTPAPEMLQRALEERLLAERAAERAACERALAGLAQAAQQLHGCRERLAQELRRAAVELALAVATRFLHEKVAAGDFPFELLIRQAGDRLEHRGPLQVFLSPEDLRLLQERLGAGHVLFDQAQFRLGADPALARGACKVSGHETSILFDLDERLTALRQQLLEQAHPDNQAAGA